MTAPVPIHGLSELAGHYDVLLCDVWGVIHNGRWSFPEACAALVRWQAEVGPVVLISNAPRPSTAIHPQLDGLKVPRAAWSTLVTSGDVTRALLAERAPGPFWAIGPDRDSPLYDGLGLDFTGPEAAKFITVTGPNDDTVETPEDYRERFEAVAARKLPMVCANPDIVVKRGHTLIYCAGALAQLYETLGGPVVMAGKPFPAIYDLALIEAMNLLDRRVDPARVLCVGDGVATDVKGANAQGLDLLFVAAGIHGHHTVGDDGLDAAALETLLAEEGAKARWAIAELAW
jgi:HAD superfamily hydrolase (TIGR01459 family)